MALAENAVLPSAYPHIRLEDGVARIRGSRITVVHIVRDYLHGLLTPVQIQERYPHLSLAEIHSALAYYDDNRAAIDAEIERRRHYAEEMQAAATGQYARAELEERAA